VSDDGLDVNVDGDVPRDTGEERQNLGPAAQWLETAYLEDTVCAERLRKGVELASIARPVVPRESIPDLLTGDQFPHRPRRDSSPDRRPRSYLPYHS
jgi:hypothetical protein